MTPRRSGRPGRFLRDNGLTLAFGVAFLVVLAAQAVAGRAEYNSHQVAAGQPGVSLGAYLTSSDFAVDVTENWQSEYLQFSLYILATVWLAQRGSPESKPVARVGREDDARQLVGAHAWDTSPRWARARGWRLTLFSHSLLLVMGGLFVLSWLAQSVSGVASYNEERLMERQAPISWAEYLTCATFWNRTLQNWQPELLAMASMVILTSTCASAGPPSPSPSARPTSPPAPRGEG